MLLGKKVSVSSAPSRSGHATPASRPAGPGTARCGRAIGEGHPRPGPGRFGLAVLALACLAACSRPPEPVTGYGGLAFGDPRPGECVALDVPLPRGLAEDLVYCACPGRGGPFFGAAPTDAVYGFYQGRFFAVSATLSSREAAEALGRGLTRSHGSPYCRETPLLAVCLWRAGEADVVLETPSAGPSRLVVRHRGLAGRVAAAGAASPAPREAPAPGDDPPQAP